MGFEICKTCGHSHNVECTDESLGFTCHCTDVNKETIQNIDKLIQKIEEINKENYQLMEQRRNGIVNITKEAMVQKKIHSLSDRYNKHYGIISYNKPQPI